MIKSLIDAIPYGGPNTEYERRVPCEDGKAILNISEHFYDTIQGENIVGNPSSFLRLQGCTLACVWCDTLEVWKRGNPYTVGEVVDMWEESGLAKKFEEGQHLILTGGSPLKQQAGLNELIKEYTGRGYEKPFIEIENECTIMPAEYMIEMVDVWNNSPKLANSGMHERARYKPAVLEKLGQLDNSYFKFVITEEDNWNEIKKDFVDTGFVTKDQIVVMPEGVTRKEIQAHYDAVVEIAVRETVRMSDRMHVTIWNEKTGV